MRHKHLTGKIDSLPLCRSCDSIVDGFFVGKVLNDLYLKAAAYSIIRSLEKENKIVLCGADLVGRFMLLHKSFYDKTALVVDKFESGLIRGKLIGGIDSLRTVDSGTVVVTTTNSFEAKDICKLISRKKNIKIVRLDQELALIERKNGELGVEVDMNGEAIFNLFKEIKHKKIVMFGTGQAAETIAHSFPLDIDYYVDNNSAKWDQTFLGLKIKNPTFLRNENKGEIAIFIASIYHEEISKQLEEMGYKENQHFWNVLEIFNGPTSSSKSLLDHYGEYRKNYNIHPSVLFNGEGILLYGRGEICMGENSYIGRFSSIQADENCKVHIGKGCRISHFVKIYTSNLESDQDFSCENLIKKSGDVMIGDYCWIGAGVFIKEGVRIGENTVIGANSVVTKDIPSYAIAGGVPAKVIKYKSCKAEAEGNSIGHS